MFKEEKEKGSGGRRQREEEEEKEASQIGTSRLIEKGKLTGRKEKGGRKETERGRRGK